MKKVFLIAFAIVTSTQVFAGSRSFSVVDNATGEQFFCTNNGGASGGQDVNCVSDVAQLCRSSTSLGGTACFQDATTACKNSGPQFSKCVDSTSQECRNSTSLGGTACFQQSVTSCRN